MACTPHHLSRAQERPTTTDVQEDNIADKENGKESPNNRRRHLRSVFAYPVEFRIFSQKATGGTAFSGNITDISIGGARLQIDDPHGRFHAQSAEKGRVILTLSIPRENRIKIFAHIQWVKRNEGSPRIRIGVSFKGLDQEGLMVIEKLIGLKGKDQNMLWNLWEQYYH
jgi:hypothetical protein